MGSPDEFAPDKRCKNCNYGKGRYRKDYFGQLMTQSACQNPEKVPSSFAQKVVWILTEEPEYNISRFLDDTSGVSCKYFVPRI